MGKPSWNRCVLAACFGLASGFAAHAFEPGDLWLQRYSISASEWEVDHDNDGFSARSEYLFGTNPRNAASRPPALTAATDLGNIILRWPSQPGVHYRIAHSPVLGSWTNLDPVVIGNSSVLELAVPATNSMDFFRMTPLEPSPDVDGDGLSDVEEALLGTNRLQADTDGDGLRDGSEVFVTFTDPLVPNLPGGTITGTVRTDPNGDSNPADGGPVAGAEVYLDLNFDGTFNAGEPRAMTGTNGAYVFTFLKPGVYHVRQRLLPGQFQTQPAPAASPVLNRLPDEVYNYTHSPEGALPVPYGVLADPTALVPTIRFASDVPVDPAITLKPIGLRGLLPPFLVWTYNEYLSIPEHGSITWRFDEKIIDQPGADLLIHVITQGINEQATVQLGLTPDTLRDAGLITEQMGATTTGIPIDLAAVGITGAVQYVKITSISSQGASAGFDLVGAEAIHFAPVRTDAIEVVVVGTEQHENKDFARQFRDNPPDVFLFVDGGPFNAGQSARVRVQAQDDVGLASIVLTANNTPVTLNTSGEGTVPLPIAGTMDLVATATDSSAQSTTRNATLYVNEADGTSPFNFNLTGPGVSGPYDLRIVTPPAGAILAENTPVVVSIVGSPTPHWTLEYAPLDLVDPANLGAADPDWISLGQGDGVLANQAAGTLPVNSLPDGIYFVRFGATPSTGGAIAYQGQVFAKGVAPEDIQPRVVITSPVPGSQVSLTVPIIGSITSTRPLVEWAAEYAPANQVDLNQLGSDTPPWKRFASGNNPITNGVFATFDATLVPEGSYVIRVTAWNDLRLGWVEPLMLEVAGADFKPGRLRREFTDLNLPVGGIPFTIRRIYDSLNADQGQGLGFGWSLAFFDPQIGETVPSTGVGAFGATPFRDGTRVYLNTPEGKRVGFTFHPEVAYGSAFGAVYRARFDPDPGVYEKLATPEGTNAFLTIDNTGNAFVFFVGLAWNPSVYLLTTPDGIQYTYEEKAGFVEARDRNGNVLIATADGLRHSGGLSVTFTRDARQRITGINAPDGNSIGYSYNAAGDLVGVTNRDGLVTTFGYHPQLPHYLQTVTDPLGRTGTSYEYDETGRLIATVDEHGNRAVQSWDPGSFQGSITDRNGNVTRLVYNARGNVLAETNALGQVTTFAYDDPANPDRATSRRDARGNTTTWTYDARGNTTAVRRPLDEATATYDANGRLLTARGFNEPPSAYTYDARGNLASASEPGKATQTYEYSPDGRRVAAYVTETGGPGRTFTTTWSYSGDGRLAGVNSDHGFRAQMQVSANGDLTSVSLPGGRVFSFGYDADGSPNRETDANGGQTTSTVLANGTRRVTDRLGRVTDYQIAADDLPEKVTRADGLPLTLGRDAERNLTNVTDAAGQSWKIQYDAMKRPVRFIDPTGAFSTFAYDEAGNLVEAVNRNGKRRTFVYDASDRLTRERWHADDGAIVREFTYTYTPLGFGDQGSLNQVTDGVSTWSIAGILPRPGSVTFAYPGQVARTVSYGWDQNGVTGQGAANQGCCGDAGAGAGGASGLAAPTLITVTGGADFYRITATYDGPNLTRLQWSAPGDFFGPEMQFVHDTNGVLTETRRLYGPLRSRSTYAWDALGRLTNYSHLDTNNLPLHSNAPTTLTRDAASRIVGMTRPGDTATYAYDALDQLTNGTHTGFAAESYRYDASGNRVASHGFPGAATIGPANRILAVGTLAFAYDAEGNVREKTDSGSGQVTRFTYDHRNQLTLATVHSNATALASTTVAFEYDYEGRMMSRTVDGAKTWIIYDRQMPIGEFADGADAVNAAFLYSPNRLDDFHASWRAGAGERFFLKDHLGTVLGATDQNGVLLYWTTLDAFGQPLSPGPAGADPIRFAGRPYNEALGLYEMRARFYDPVLGRFTQEDPLGMAGGDVNLYRYAGNNPLQFNDPTGQNAALEYVTLAVALVRPANLCNLGVCVAGILNGVAKSITTLSPTQQGSAGCIGSIAAVPVPTPTGAGASLAGAAVGGAFTLNSGQAGPFGQLAGAAYCAAKAGGYLPQGKAAAGKP
jgi:RHS repeat-associated protein